MARPADALQPARDRLRRLHLDDEVDCAHVDAQLERRSGDEARDLPLLQELLHLDPLLPRERAVVGSGQLALRQLVQAQREALRQAAVVDEDDRRAVLLDEPQDLRVDRRPDRAGAELGARVHLLAVRGRRVRERDVGRQLAHVLHRHDDLEVELLRAPGVDELDRPAARDEAADLLQRPLRGREADALHRRLHEPVEPLHGEREVGAALRPGDGVHLVEDQRLDRPQHLARLRREDEEERLGGRDEDVRRLARHLLALLLRRVARAHGHAQLRAQPGQRAAEVALDVVVQRLERRHVEQAQALARARVQPVDAVEERRERLPRAGRRLDEDVPALRDRRPAERLGRRRLGERTLEPGPSLVSEQLERAHEARLARPTHDEQVFDRYGSRVSAGPPLLHRERRGRPAARRGAAGAADRLRARPAGVGARGLLGPAEDEAAARHAGRRRHRRARPRAARGCVPREARDPPLSRARWPAACRSSAAPSSPNTAATRHGSGRRRRTRTTCAGGSATSPASGR